MGGRGGGRGGGAVASESRHIVAARESHRIEYSDIAEKALDHYISTSEYINDVLRFNRRTGLPELDAKVSGYINALDKIMKSNVRLAAQSLYRATSVKSMLADLNSGKAIGKTYFDKGFVSTSHTRHVGAFLTDSPIAMRISVPKGSKGIALGHRNPQEREVILNRGSGFKVTSARKVDGQWHVKVDLIQGK